MSVPVDHGIMHDEPTADGGYRIDPAELWAAAIQLAEGPADWTVEDRQVSPHPTRKAPPRIAEQRREQDHGE